MEFRHLNNREIPHIISIVSDESESLIYITRSGALIASRSTVVISVYPDAPFNAVMRRINSIANLDDELFEHASQASHARVN